MLKLLDDLYRAHVIVVGEVSFVALAIITVIDILAGDAPALLIAMILMAVTCLAPYIIYIALLRRENRSRSLRVAELHRASS